MGDPVFMLTVFGVLLTTHLLVILIGYVITKIRGNNGKRNL